MKQRAFCHNCGADVMLDEPIQIDDFSMIGDGYQLHYKGVPVGLTFGERIITWSLLKAYPDYVTRSTLLDRLDSDGIDLLANVHVCRIRHKLAIINAPNPIETVHQMGYRWKPIKLRVTEPHSVALVALVD